MYLGLGDFAFEGGRRMKKGEGRYGVSIGDTSPKRERQLFLPSLLGNKDDLELASCYLDQSKEANAK